jgi:hypothetical protein
MVYIYYIKNVKFWAIKNPPFGGLGLEQSHCQPQHSVKYWCNDDGGYFGVLLAELFHVFLL